MSDLETNTPGPLEEPPAPLNSDPWQIWFTRAVQVVGLGIMVFEAVGRKAERPWLMLFAAGMMLGGMGLQSIVRWAAGRIPQ